MKPLELAAFRDFISKKYQVPPPKIGMDFESLPHCCLTKDHPIGEGLHMDGFYEDGFGVLSVRWDSKNPMLTLGHEFHHYYLSLKGKATEKSMEMERFIDEQAAADLEEFRAAS